MKHGLSTAIKSPTAFKILAYLAENPKAQDTVEGIVHWWLLELEIKQRTTQVQEALAELVSKRLVIKQEGRDSHIYYRINSRKSREIRALLKKVSE